MIAELMHDEDYDLIDATSYRQQATPQIQRQTSSRTKWNTQSRYRRTKSGGNGAHLRRQRRVMV